MTRIRCAGSIALSLVLAASSATAQTDTARIGQLLKNGQKITLVDDDGRELEGRVAEVSSSSLGLTTDDGRIDLSLDRIVRIDHPRDGLGNGALIGMGTLVGLSLISLAAHDHSCPANARCPDTSPSALVVLWISGSMAAFGAGIGVAIDAMIHRKDAAIYKRGTAARATIGPAIGPGVRGAVVSVSW
jgi:hypothetical protein